MLLPGSGCSSVPAHRTEPASQQSPISFPPYFGGLCRCRQPSPTAKPSTGTPFYLQCHANMVQDRRSTQCLTNNPGQSLRKAWCQRDRREAPLSRKVGWQHDQGPGKSLVHVEHHGTWVTWGGKGPGLKPCLLLPNIAKQEPTKAVQASPCGGTAGRRWRAEGERHISCHDPPPFSPLAHTRRPKPAPTSR